MDEIRFSLESELDFDTFKALMMTVTGVCAAFIAIGSMMLFTVISMRFTRWWNNRTQPPDAPQPSGAVPETRMEADSDADAQIAAAVGTAVALAMGTGPANSAGADEGDAGPAIRGWRSVGRWPQVQPGSTWRRPEGGRDREKY